MPKLVDALVDALITLDVRYVFGVSGANIEHLHDAIHRRGQGKLVSIFARSESGAAFMADARARVHRTLGVCCATSGGGMMNLAVGIAEAHAESVPVLAIVGQPDEALAGRGAFQDSSGRERTDALKLFEAISKLAVKITRGDEFWPALQTAVVAALAGRPGPAVLLLPRCVQSSDVPEMPPGFFDEIRARTHPPDIDEDDLERAFHTIRTATHPVLLVGHGVRRSGASGAIGEFARAARIPVATTMSARSEFDNRDRLFLGVLGVGGHPSVSQYIEQTADLIIVAGAGLNAMTRAALRNTTDARPKRVVAVNVEPRQVKAVAADPNAGVALQAIVEGDARVAFDALLARWRATPFEIPPHPPYQRRYFAPTAIGKPAPPDNPLLQSDALAILSRYLPQAGHLVYDAGNCAAAAVHFLDVPSGVSATVALGMGGMGYAVAGAIGAQLGSPAGTWTAVIVGDGGFLITGFEIHSAVDLKLPILFVVFNNASHGMCVTRQHVLFEGREECVRYAPVDITQVARGFGTEEALWVGRARSASELYDALDEYGARPAGPGVLELCIARDELPPFLPLLPPGAATTTMLIPPVAARRQAS